jgi:RNA 2',3'-cyclic 3'-phosphodiesterase
MAPEATIRAFLAVDIGPEVRENLRRLQERLQRSQADVRWVRPESIHLTLRFLGNVPAVDLEKLAPVMAVAAAGQAPVELTVSGWGMFPNQSRPRVLWVGLPQGREKLGQVAEELERGMIEAGFGPEDRPWKPHLTLGRFKSLRGLDQLSKALAKEGEQVYGRIQADRLTLFQSQLQRSGAVYTALRESRFGSSP